MDLTNILRNCRLGDRVAENESTNLGNYFCKTELYWRLLNGDVDIVTGAKGTGKSALYLLLLSEQDKSEKEGLNDKGIFLVSAEEPRGEPVFENLKSDPPTSETRFIILWKVYFLVLSDAFMRKNGITNSHARSVNSFLANEKLAGSIDDLYSLLISTVEFIKRLARPKAVEPKVGLDPNTHMPTSSSLVIEFADPEKKVVPLRKLLNEANAALEKAGVKLWLLVDRLDVAFLDSNELEKNAIRALFRASQDLQTYPNIKPKIFIRSDIWKRITTQSSVDQTPASFPELSHITRDEEITWTRNVMMNLVIRRFLNNPIIESSYDVKKSEVLKSLSAQEALFYRIFPRQVDLGNKKVETFDWIINRTCDGHRKPSPREVIHLLNCCKKRMLTELQIGNANVEDQQLFSRTSIKHALDEVSKARLHKTLYAEYPETREYIEKLNGTKTSQSIESLTSAWEIDKQEAEIQAKKLVEVGFFEEPSGNPRQFRVPFLYRPAAGMVQGTSLK